MGVNRTLLAGMGVASLLLGAVLLAGRGDDDDDGDTAGGGRVEHTTGMTATLGEEVVVRVTDFAFDPPELRVTAQNRYMLHLVNDSGQLHDWTIDAMPATDVRIVDSAGHEPSQMGTSEPMATSTVMPPGMGTAMPGSQMMRLHVAAEKGDDRHISFVPMEKGEYVFYCTVGNHREAGMEGKLVVE